MSLVVGGKEREGGVDALAFAGSALRRPYQCNRLTLPVALHVELNKKHVSKTAAMARKEAQRT